MQPREVIQRRLTSQGLLDSRFEAVEDVMEWMVAVQAQERAIVPWSLGQRTREAVEADVREALRNGSILRTHLLRPTWHYISNADIGWLLDLAAPRVHGLNGPYYRKLELDPSLLVTCSDLLARALEGHRHHTRVDLQKVLEANGVFINGIRLSYILMYAELEKVVCSGAPRGKHHTYAVFDERVVARRSLSNDEALAELTLRFFRSRGPATLRDYCLWSSLTVRQAKRGLDQVEDSLESREMDGLICWMASDFGAVATSRHQVHFLQGYDEYFVSYGETRGIHAAPDLSPSPSSGDRPFLHVVVLDGQVVGRWQRRMRKNDVTLEVQISPRLARTRASSFRTAAARYQAFLDMPVQVEYVASATV
jgi:hypothetical protein